MNMEYDLENVISSNIEKQSQNFQDDISRSMTFQTRLLDAVRGDSSLNLKKFVRENLEKNYLYGIDILTLLSPDFTSRRDFMSCVALSLCFSKAAEFEIVYADLKNIASFKRIQENNLYQLSLTSTTSYTTYFIQTKNHVFYPALNLIMKIDDFYDMTAPVVLDRFYSSELEKSKIYRRLVQSKNTPNPENFEFDYAFINRAIDHLMCESGKVGQGIFSTTTAKINYLEMLLYQKLAADRVTLAQLCFAISNGLFTSQSLPSNDPASDNDYMQIYQAIIDNPNIL